jgi:CcmD family protein
MQKLMLREGSPAAARGPEARKTVWGGRVFLAALAIALALLCVPASAQQPTTPQQPQEGFVPIEQLPNQEQLPAAPLVMAAYAVAWVAVFGYLWSLWRRLDRVERDIASVTRRVEAGGRR